MPYAATDRRPSETSDPTSRPKPDRIADLLARPDLRNEVEARFWEKVARREPDACWEYQGARKRAGYGNVRLPWRASVSASRLSWALRHNCSPGGLFVCHRCDNPPCCNPDHLFLGTCADNSADMMAKGRWCARDQAGQNNGAAKLTANDVEVVRELIRLGQTNTAIAARYGVTHQAVSRIRRGRSWGSPAMCEPYRRKAA